MPGEVPVPEEPRKDREVHDFGEGPTSPVGSPTPSGSPLPRGLGAPDPHVPFVVPVQIAGYRIVRLLGSGGMGLVYEAVQETLGRSVALKVMQPGGVSAEALARFESEARALGKLSHPGIARVFDAGVFRPGPDDRTIVPYLSMELIEGGVTFGEFCERDGAGLEAKLRLILGACDALEHAHASGIIHRDLKPSNMLVAPGSSRVGSGTGPSIKLIDFGIAKVLGDGSRTITSRGQWIGTPSFMAPEQLLGGAVDARTDIFALGVVLYQLCTGRLPHEASSASDRRDIQRAVCETPPVPPRAVDRTIEADLETIILKCLQKQSSDRYQTARELGDDLAAFLAGDAIRARRDGPVRRAGRAIGRFAARRPRLAMGASVLVALLFGMGIVNQAMLRWPALGMGYWKAVSVVTPMSGSLPDVRIIAIDDATDFATLGAAEGLSGVSNDNIKSVRLLHAAVLRRLARGSPRAVGIDVLFRKSSEFDGPLAGAISELRRGGVGVVLATPSWQFEADGTPPIVKEFSGVAWAGPPTGGFHAPEIWTMELALERAEAEVVPSFVLLTYAASREPEAEIAVALSGTTAEVRYFKRGTDRRATLRSPDRVRYSGTETMDGADDERGLAAGDKLAAFLTPIPRDGLARSTIPMQKVLAMTEVDLRREFGGRIVLVGNASQAGGDLQVAPSGESVPGVWMNASAVQQMLRDEVLRVPVVLTQWIVAAAWGAAGVLGVWWLRGVGQGAIWLLALTAGALVGSVLLLRTGGTLWNPIPGIAAGCLGCGLAIITSHQAKRIGSFRTRRF